MVTEILTNEDYFKCLNQTPNAAFTLGNSTADLGNSVNLQSQSVANLSCRSSVAMSQIGDFQHRFFLFSQTKTTLNDLLISIRIETRKISKEILANQNTADCEKQILLPKVQSSWCSVKLPSINAT